MALEKIFKEIRKEIQLEIDRDYRELIVPKYTPAVEETVNKLKDYLKKYKLTGIVIFGGAPSIEEAVFFEDGHCKYEGKNFASVSALTDHIYDKDEDKGNPDSSFQYKLEWILEMLNYSAEKFEYQEKKIKKSKS